jgi:hypothetical protein
MNTNNIVKRYTFTEMKAAGESIGYTWFSKGNMDFFNTVLECQPNKYNMFITSEKTEDWQKRRYTLRWFNDGNAQIYTISGFMEFTTMDAVRAHRRTIMQMIACNEWMTPKDAYEVMIGEEVRP